MKKIIKYTLTAAIAAMTATAASAATDTPDTVTQPVDTVLCVKNANSVIITENTAGVSVDVRGVENDSEFQTSYTLAYDNNSVIKSRQSFAMPFSLKVDRCNDIVGMLQGVHFGFTGAVDAPSQMNTQMGKSFEIGIDNIIFYGHKFGASKRNMLSVGMGVNWRNYRMTGENRFDMDNGNAVIIGYPEDADGKFSRIKVFSLTFPVSYTYYSPVKALGNSYLGFKLSALLNWNSHASMLTVYELADGTKVKENYDRIGQRKFSIDVMLGVQIAPAVSLYFKYSPYDLFKSDTASPKFQTISTGIALGF